MKAGGERRRLCLRKSALAGSWSCVSGYLPGACALSLLSGRAGLWAARALAALMGSVRARWQADGSRLPLRPHLPGHVPDMHACLRDVLLFLCVRFAPVVAAHCTARSSAAPSAPLFLLWGCCLPWVLSLPAGREFFGVGWCLFHLPHSLWELAWLISALVSPLPCLACPRAAARGSKSFCFSCPAGPRAAARGSKSLASLVRHVPGP